MGDFIFGPILTHRFLLSDLTSVLIAIVEDAYSRAKIKSFALFGRARVEYVARQQIRERFLKPVEERASYGSREYATQLLRRWIRWGVALSVVAVVVSVGTLLVLTIRECIYTVVCMYRNILPMIYLLLWSKRLVCILPISNSIRRRLL